MSQSGVDGADSNLPTTKANATSEESALRLPAALNTNTTEDAPSLTAGFGQGLATTNSTSGASPININRGSSKDASISTTYVFDDRLEKNLTDEKNDGVVLQPLIEVEGRQNQHRIGDCPDNKTPSKVRSSQLAGRTTFDERLKKKLSGVGNADAPQPSLKFDDSAEASIAKLGTLALDRHPSDAANFKESVTNDDTSSTLRVGMLAHKDSFDDRLKKKLLASSDNQVVTQAVRKSTYENRIAQKMAIESTRRTINGSKSSDDKEINSRDRKGAELGSIDGLPEKPSAASNDQFVTQAVRKSTYENRIAQKMASESTRRTINGSKSSDDKEIISRDKKGAELGSIDGLPEKSSAASNDQFVTQAVRKSTYENRIAQKMASESTRRTINVSKSSDDKEIISRDRKGAELGSIDGLPEKPSAASNDQFVTQAVRKSTYENRIAQKMASESTRRMINVSKSSDDKERISRDGKDADLGSIDGLPKKKLPASSNGHLVTRAARKGTFEDLIAEKMARVSTRQTTNVSKFSDNKEIIRRVGKDADLDIIDGLPKPKNQVVTQATRKSIFEDRLAEKMAGESTLRMNNKKKSSRQREISANDNMVTRNRDSAKSRLSRFESSCSESPSLCERISKREESSRLGISTYECKDEEMGAFDGSDLKSQDSNSKANGTGVLRGFASIREEEGEGTTLALARQNGEEVGDLKDKSLDLDEELGSDSNSELINDLEKPTTLPPAAEAQDASAGVPILEAYLVEDGSIKGLKQVEEDRSLAPVIYQATPIEVRPWWKQRTTCAVLVSLLVGGMAATIGMLVIPRGNNDGHDEIILSETAADKNEPTPPTEPPMSQETSIMMSTPATSTAVSSEPAISPGNNDGKENESSRTDVQGGENSTDVQTPTLIESPDLDSSQDSAKPSASPSQSSSPTISCLPLFDPSSKLTTYVDHGFCGPRGDDAKADTSECPNGAEFVCRYDGISNGWEYITIDGCNYFAFQVMQCVPDQPKEDLVQSQEPLCLSLFDPNSKHTSYVDQGFCGPRGDDAKADTSDCPNGAEFVCSYDGISNGWEYITLDGCNYYAFEVFECNTP